jgi:hypothetical protein
VDAFSLANRGFNQLTNPMTHPLFVVTLLHQVAQMLKNQAAFLLRLHDTLSLAMNPDGSPAVHWDEDGKSFYIVDPKRFLDVLSIYYDNLSFPTFEQKLSGWGFIKNPADGTLGGATADITPKYSHPFFTRDEKPVICRIKSAMQVLLKSVFSFRRQ